MKNTDKGNARNRAVNGEVIGNPDSKKSTRGSNYSGMGYHTLKSPISQAERWNMPFADPEFEYESQSEGLH